MVGAVLRHICLTEDVPGNSLHALVSPRDSGDLAFHRLVSFQICSVASRAILGVTIGIVLKNLLHNLGLKFSVRALCDFSQIKVLDRIAVGIELETTAQRSEIGFL